MEPQFFLREALKLAEQAVLLDEVPVGAVVVHEGKVIGSGFNTREREQDPTGHAEIKAIQMAAKALNSWRLLECDLYVTLEPCPMCLSACQQARIRKVIYGAKDEKGGAICLGFHVHDHPKLNHQFEVLYSPVEECSQILKDFFLRRRTEQKSAKLVK
jgi:tRNA(adenine34) deaminase